MRRRKLGVLVAITTGITLLVGMAIDSRTDLYGKQRILANRDLVAGRRDAVHTLDADGVTCVLVPSGSGLVGELKQDNQWRVVDTDSRRTLLVRS